MLLATKDKAASVNFAPPLVEADALDLPFADNTLDAISISFGFRNLANYGAGLRELYRVLKPEGRVAVLEFSHPPELAMRFGYGLYSTFLCLLSGPLSLARAKLTAIYPIP